MYRPSVVECTDLLLNAYTVPSVVECILRPSVFESQTILYGTLQEYCSKPNGISQTLAPCSLGGFSDSCSLLSRDCVCASRDPEEYQRCLAYRLLFYVLHKPWQSDVLS